MKVIDLVKVIQLGLNDKIQVDRKIYYRSDYNDLASMHHDIELDCMFKSDVNTLYSIADMYYNYIHRITTK